MRFVNNHRHSLTRYAGLLGCLLLFAPACAGDPEGPATPPEPCADCAAESGQLRVTNPDARACEVLVEATGGRVVSVDFGAGTAGKLVSEGDRAGISIVSTDAAPLPSVVGTVHFNGALGLLRGVCYDAAGNPLAADSLSL